MKKQRRFPLRKVGIAAIALACLLALIWTGALPLNLPPQPVRGVDVSHHQGDIDWDTLASQSIQFAFIKATEGSAYIDEKFEENWRGAIDAGLAVGAYHFFSYDSPGARQAEHFIARVPVLHALPPTIDVEFYGDYARNPAPKDKAVAELRAMVDALTAYYGRAPILYTTSRAWKLYIEGAFDDCDLWIRSVYTPPGRQYSGWKFWQYSSRTRLRGTSGRERAIDLNVFSGTQAEFDWYARRKEDHATEKD